MENTIILKDGKRLGKKQINVQKQLHYVKQEVQPIEYCEKNKLGWCAANVVKYLTRAELKNGKEDYEKAFVYMGTLLHYKRTGEFVNPDRLIISVNEAK